jgi:membrane protein YdbS with pleckstrin-like domain
LKRNFTTLSPKRRFLELAMLVLLRPVPEIWQLFWKGTLVSSLLSRAIVIDVVAARELFIIPFVRL